MVLSCMLDQMGGIPHVSLDQTLFMKRQSLTVPCSREENDGIQTLHHVAWTAMGR